MSRDSSICWADSVMDIKLAITPIRKKEHMMVQ